jgi:hypothetical protein
MLTPRWFPWLAAGLLLLAAGCGSGGHDVFRPVRGRVLYRGVPLSGGTIVFSPDPERGGSGPLAVADIQPDGYYVLKTEDRPGAAAGWYRVTVVALQVPPASPGAAGWVPARSLVPAKYRDPELSGLSCQVRDDQDNNVEFNLE